MKKYLLALAVFGGFFVSQDIVSADSVAMQRLYNPNSGEHFYTGSMGERDFLVRKGWQYEGVGWQSPNEGQPVYRLYNPNTGDHHYTVSIIENNWLVSKGWRAEGVGWQSAPANEQVVYRLYNPNEQGAGAHHYTQSKAEYDWLASKGWKQEGIAWYAYEQPKNNDIPIIYVPDDPAKSDASDTNPPTNTDTDNTTVPPTDTPVNPVVPSEPIDNSSEPNEPMIEPFDGRAVAEEVFRLVNEERRNVGVPELKWSEKLYEASLIRAHELIKLYSHTRPDGSSFYHAWKLVGISGKSGIAATGENVAITFIKDTNKETALKLFSKWKASPGHYENMIRGEFDYFACGVIYDTPNLDVVSGDVDKVIYGVQSFVTETSPGSFSS